MFEQTSTGFRATDEQVAFWEARDTCPACTALHSPWATVDGTHYYQCNCNCGGIAPDLSPWLPISWTRRARQSAQPTP